MARIVVAVDGSEHAQQALEWAVAEAAAHGHVLEVVTVSPPEVLPGGAWVAPPPATDLMLALKQVQTDALAAVDTTSVPEVIETREIGFPSEVLVERGRGSDLLILGSRGFGALRGALLGSVSRQVATHATCPVAVIRGPARPIERIVVGVDGSEHSLRALRWAHHEARIHEAELEAVAVQAWPGFAAGAPWMPLAAIPDPTSAAREETGERLDRAVAKVTSDERVIRTVVEGAPAEGILGRAEDADLLIVGRRGLGGFERLILGSVSARCLTHAPCPTVIVPGG